MKKSRQRKNERFQLRIPAKIWSDTEIGSEQYLCVKVSNISAGGAFFEGLRLPLENEGCFVVEFDIPAPDPLLEENTQGVRVTIDATVERINSQGTAVSFSDKYKMEPLKASSR